MLAKITENHVARAKRMIGCGLDVEEVSQWLATHDADKAEVERLRKEKKRDDDFVLRLNQVMLRDRRNRATDYLQEGCELATMISDWAIELESRRAVEAKGGGR